MVDGILYCPNLSLYMHFKVGSRSPATKLCVTTANNSFRSLTVFVPKSSILDVAKGFIQNTLNTISNTFAKLMEVSCFLKIRRYDFVK